MTTIGSISHGTMRLVDLIPTFADELERIVRRQKAAGFQLRDDYSDLIKEAGDWVDEQDEEQGDFILNRLFDALDEQAPPYCRFGTSEGDGSDYGFWPVMESIEELPRVNDSDEAKALGEDAYFVNDHGNVTVFGGDGSVILEFV